MKRFLSLAAFTSGFAVMGAEVAAGRLLAPSFGTSTLVWSLLIGIVLTGLAVGARIGGRWSRRPHALRRTFAANAIAGVALMAIPILARPLMRATLDQFLHGHLLLLIVGFVAVLAMLVVPVVLLGATSPVLVHHATAERDDVGETAGRLGALGTMGSLAGTFVCGVVLVPLLGTEFTFRVCGSVALVVGLVGVARTSHASLFRKPAATVATAAAVGIALCLLPRIAVHAGPKALVETETAYNYVRVVDDAEYRTLFLNEGYAAQTIARHDGRAYLRGVWGYYAIAPALTKRPPRRVLVIGLGGGGSARDYAERLPAAEIVAVELDQGIVQVARHEFGLPASVKVHEEDARAFLAHDGSRYDLVVIDAFQFPYVPFQLTTREFYEQVQGHLEEGGAVMTNVGRKGNQLGVVHAVASTLATVFPHVNGVNVSQTTNTILVATRHELAEAGGQSNVRFSADELRELDALEPLGPWTVPDGAALVLTDDRAPIEWLTHRIIVRELALMMRSSES